MTRLQCWSVLVKDIAKAERFFSALGLERLIYLDFKEKVPKEVIERQGFREPDEITLMSSGGNPKSDECFVEIVKFDKGFGYHYLGMEENMVVFEVDDCQAMFDKLTAIPEVKVIRAPAKYEKQVAEAGEDFFSKVKWRPYMAAFIEVDIGRDDGKRQAIELIQVKRE